MTDCVRGWRCHEPGWWMHEVHGSVVRQDPVRIWVHTWPDGNPGGLYDRLIDAMRALAGDAKWSE